MSSVLGLIDSRLALLQRVYSAADSRSLVGGGSAQTYGGLLPNF